MKAWKTKGAFLERLRNTDRRDWKVFFLSLLLAFSIWIIHNLSLSYSDFVDVNVRAVSTLEGRVSASTNLVTVHAQCRMSGYNLLYIRWQYRHRECRLQLDPSSLRHGSADSFYITARDLQEYNQQIFGETAKVEYFFTDTLFFNFPPRISRKVPVVLVGDISCREQYMLDGPVRLIPDSVTVYGEPMHLDRIDAVYTNRLVKTELDRDVKGEVKLRGIKDVSFSQESVAYLVPVLRYTELSSSFRLKILNLPADKDAVLIPSEVKASFLCPFPPNSDPLESATLYVDYNDFLSSREGRCLVRMSGYDGKILDWKAEPAMVECLVMDR